MCEKKTPENISEALIGISDYENKPSVKLLLDVLFHEYKEEDERSRGINSRAGILVSAIIVMISLFFQVINIPDLMQKGTEFQKIIFYIAIICTVLCVPVLLFALCVRKYNRFEIQPFLKEKTKKLNYDISVSFLIDALGDKIKYNKKKNDKKANTYSVGLILLIVSLILIVATLILQPANFI